MLDDNNDDKNNCDEFLNSGIEAEESTEEVDIPKGLDSDLSDPYWSNGTTAINTECYMFSVIIT